MHLLKWRYQSAWQSRSWQSTILTQRAEIEGVLSDSPSLRQQLPLLLRQAYRLACLRAERETGLPLTTFPEVCPWSAEQILDDGFWPEGNA
jgi:hypothetical protein